VLVVVAGLVVVVVAGLDAVVVVAAAGLEVVGAFGAADGVCATTREAVANRVVSNRVVGLMVRRFCGDRPLGVKLGVATSLSFST
jgi:hypothetical protein